MGDWDGDGIPDVAIGANLTSDPVLGASVGALWIMTLDANGNVKTETRISPGMGGFPNGLLESGDRFGNGLARVADLDGNGTPDLLVAATYDDDGPTNAGAAYVVFLDRESPNAPVIRVEKVSALDPLLTPELEASDFLGWGLAAFPALDASGVPGIAVSSIQDDDAERVAVRST